MDRLLHISYYRTPKYLKYLLKNFEEPAGINPKPVPLNIDGANIDVESSKDLTLQKYMYCNHVTKFFNMTEHVTSSFIITCMDWTVLLSSNKESGIMSGL